MDADIKELLWFQLNGSFNLLSELARETTDAEWKSRAFPHANLVGFTVWHGARTIDWTVNCVLRGGYEVADAAEWSDVRPEEAVFGAGASRESADGVAMRIPRLRVLEYITALREPVMAWMTGLSPADLAGTVDLKTAHTHRPSYQSPAVWDEVADLDGIPRWQFLARPAVSHIRVHYGEVTSQLEAIRAAAPAERL